MLVGILGPIPFMGGNGSAFTLHQLKEKYKNAFAKHRILQGNDLIEDVGVDPIEIDFQMEFFAPWTLSPAASISALKLLASLKIPIPMFIGDTPIGRGPLTLYLIESIDTTYKTWSGSQCAVASASIHLIEYGNPLSIAGPLGAIASIGASVVGNLVPASASVSIGTGGISAGVSIG
jgi:Phage P2 GpU